MKLSLQLRRNIQTVLPSTEPVAGWFFRDQSTADFLDKLAQCGLADGETRLYPVPHSIADRKVAGFLVVPGSARQGMDAQSPHALPCRCRADRLFVPCDATLHPPASDDEIRKLCPFPILFFHPTLGLSGYDETSTLPVDDLIELPAERSENWNAARAGADAAPQLHSIVLANPPGLDDVFGEAKNEIGSASPGDLPPTADEPGDGMAARTGRALRGWLARGMRAMLKSAPQTARSRTWMNDLADMVTRQLEGIGKQLEQIRNKELHRLLDLLQSDPDAGLRHAISMAQLPCRGAAPPGARLASRNPDFNLRNLGGRTADTWDISPDWQQLLREKYRELADRELRLGRFRRAAYIYAELLGDFLCAAQALVQGRHFREAALLYEQHLRNPIEAARCLAQGGLFREAIERYEKLGCLLEAAALYEKMGDTTSAANLIRRVIQQRRDCGDFLGAAQLAEQRLLDVEGALGLLFEAWPGSTQAATCLTAGFQLLGRLGRLPAARERLAQLRDDPNAEAMASSLVTGLVNAARDFPDQTFRQQAADFSRVLIARQLSQPNLDTGRAAVFVDLLGRLAPHDRLLTRDGQRHLLALRTAKLTRTARPPVATVTGMPWVARRIELPRQFRWLQLRSEWYWFFAAAMSGDQLVVVRGVWDGSFQRLSWPIASALARNNLVLEPMAQQGCALAVLVPGSPRLPMQQFPAADDYFEQTCAAGTPDWMQVSNVYAFNDESQWSVHVASAQAVLSCYSTTNELRRTLDITEELVSGAVRTEESRLVLAAVRSGAAVAFGNRLVLLWGERPLISFQLPGQAIGLVPSLPHVRQAIVVPLEHGAVLQWLGSNQLIELDRDITAPIAAFLPGGPLALLSPTEKLLLLLEVDAGGVKKVTRIPLTGQMPVGVAATGSVGTYAILDRDGSLVVYRVPT